MRIRSASCAILVGTVVTLLLAQAPAQAAEQSVPQHPGGAAAAGEAPKTEGNQAAWVKTVEPFPPGAGAGPFGLDDRLKVTVENLPTLIKSRSKCDQVALYLDGLRLEGQPPERCDPAKGSLVFHLVRGDAAAVRTWNAVLAGPPANERQVEVSVGAKGSDPIPSKAPPQRFSVYRPALPGYIPAVVLLLLVLLASRRGLLQDPAPDVKVADRPYSLSRCQFAGWLVLIVGAFCLVWISTGEIPAMTTQLLSLLGVTAGTAVAGHTINSAKNDRRSFAKTAQATTPAPLNVNAPPGVPVTVVAPPPPLPIRPADLVTPQHRDFFTDILSESGAPSVTRLQHAVWTLVLWVLFAVSVYSAFGLLDFDKTLLGLMGISSLTYGAAKTGEGTKV
jgi:hypothetical protein